jgi:hypothetical protein
MFHKDRTLKHKMKHRVKTFSDVWMLSSLQAPVFKRDFDRRQMSLGRICPWHADCNTACEALT